MELKALSLFSGIGGLDLAAEMVGIETVALCEIEPFPVEVLKKRFPGVLIFEDVRKLTAEVIRDRTGMDASQTIDVVFGGFPCQDLSQAGKQVGLTGARSGLWFEMLRVIYEIRPRYVLAENVRGAVNLALDTVYANLVDEGYKVYPYVIPASAVGAPHQRERLFVVGVREDVHMRYTKAMENSRCALLQGSGECREVEREAREGAASDSKLSGSTLWPTPTSTERSGINPKTGSGAGLSKTVKLWPTPRQFMYKDSTTDRNKGNIGEKVGGQLNPDWVEQLMNFPEGWTDLEVDEPKPWQGWPALLGDSLWGTHTSTGGCRSTKFLGNADKAMTPVEFVAKGEYCEQYPYEFPRTTTGCKDRAKRLKALGNAVVPAQAYPFFRAITEIEKIIKEGGR